MLRFKIESRGSCGRPEPNARSTLNGSSKRLIMSHTVDFAILSCLLVLPHMILKVVHTVVQLNNQCIIVLYYTNPTVFL